MSNPVQVNEKNEMKEGIPIDQYCINFDFPVQQNTIDCLIVLNGETNLEQLKILRKTCANILLADGGANTFFKYGLQEDQKIRSIVGDLDSIHPEVRKYFSQKGIEIVELEDQNYNDFQKSIIYAMRKGWKTIASVGVFGTRMDHTLASFSITLRQNKLNPQLDLFLLNNSSLVYLIRPERKYKMKFGKWVSNKGCGLIPFGKVEYIQTTGFKWNLGKDEPFSSLQWGQFISSSNQFICEQVSVYSQKQIFITCNFESISS